MELAKLEAPEGVSCVSVNGKEYIVKDGYVEVEIPHIEFLLEHNFKAVEDEKPVKKLKSKENA